MTTSYYRIHQADRDPADILDPEQQVSLNWSPAADMRECPDCSGMGFDVTDPTGTDTCLACDGEGEIENIRAGVSACQSIDDLYNYIRISGAYVDNTVIVELDATSSDDQPEDAEIGEVLVHPTAILSVTPVTEDIIATIYQED